MHSNWKRNIILFLSSQTVSMFGSALVQYAIMWHITLTTQSGVMMTISIICGFLPMFFLSPFAGVWADRYPRKRLIILSDCLIAVTTLALAILYLAGHGAIWLLFAASAVRALGAAVQMPAVSAILPQIVPEDQLMRVNAVNGSIQALTMLVAPMVSAALLTLAPLETIFFIDVVTAAIAVLILLVFLRIPAHAKALEKQTVGYIHDLRAGFVYIWNHDYVRQFFVFCTFFFILAAPAAFLTPLQVTRSFGDDYWRLTAIEVTFSIGMMAGGGILATWGGFKNKIHTMTLAILMFGAGTVALGVIPNFWIYLFFMTFVGVSMPFFNTPSYTLLQEKIEGDFLGRVFSVLTMLSTSMMPLGMLVFGPIADIVSIEVLLIGTGALLFILGFFLLGSKTLIEAGKPKPAITTGEQGQS